MSDYKPSGCRVLCGIVSIGIGLVVLIAFFPVSILPAAVFIGGGARLVWGVGAI